MDAKQAKEKTEKALEKKEKEYLDGILLEIEEAANEGNYSLDFDKKERIRSYNTVKKNKSYFEDELGFVVTIHDSDPEANKVTISWAV